MDRNRRPPQRQKRTPSQGGPIRRRGSGFGMSGPLGRRRSQDMPGQGSNIDSPNIEQNERDFNGGNRGMGGALMGGLIGSLLGGLMGGGSNNDGMNGMGRRPAGCGCGCLILIILVVGAVVLFSMFGGMGNLLDGLMGMGGYGTDQSAQTINNQHGSLSDLLGGYLDTSAPTYGQNSNYQQLNVTDAPKRTQILGNGRDTVTVMLYM